MYQALKGKSSLRNRLQLFKINFKNLPLIWRKVGVEGGKLERIMADVTRD